MPKVIDFRRLRDVPRNRQQQIEQSEKRLAEQLGDLDGLWAQLTEARQENKRLKRRLLEAETLAKDAAALLSGFASQSPSGFLAIKPDVVERMRGSNLRIERDPLTGEIVVSAGKPR